LPFPTPDVFVDVLLALCAQSHVYTSSPSSLLVEHESPVGLKKAHAKDEATLGSPQETKTLPSGERCSSITFTSVRAPAFAPELAVGTEVFKVAALSTLVKRPPRDR